MTALFNGPVELGIRTLALLMAVHPRSLDLTQLVILDYFLVHSADIIDGPPSLHPPSPLRSGEVTIRRALIQDGITLFKSRLLVSEQYDEDGIGYGVGEYGSAFWDALTSEHARRLRERAIWLAARTERADPSTLLGDFAGSLERWRQEFATMIDVDLEAGAPAWAL